MRCRLISHVVLTLAFCCASPLIAVALSEQGAAAKDMKDIQGTWKVVKMEANGESAPPEIVGSMVLVFKDNSLTFKPGEPGYTNFTFKLNPTAKPAAFDMTHVDGKSKGETKRGIYSLKKDRLKICFGKLNGRPKKFTSGNGQAMYVLERVKSE